eukprot:Hpha_TRINITY_DN31338_c0_g1::TRINITY_DN31338_c0_g1_i1::g.194528::m.194528/K10106/GGCX; vitamin K-dependent gamma-carboxylase
MQAGDALQVLDVSECAGHYRLARLDTPHPASAHPGAFVMLKIPDSDMRHQGFALVSVPGDKNVVIAFASERRLPAAFEMALKPGGQFEVSIAPKSGVETQHGESRHLIFTCGLWSLASFPLYAVLRSQAQATPRVWWCVHTDEEVRGIVGLLETLGSEGKAQLVLVLCGSVAQGPSIDRLQAILGERVTARDCGEEGVSALPRLLQHEKGIAEVFGAARLRQDLSQSLPGISFQPPSCGCTIIPDAWKNDPTASHPWPARSYLPLPEWLFVETDPLPLAFYRIVLGLLCFIYVVKIYLNGRVYRDHFYVDLRFKYDFLEPLGHDFQEETDIYVMYAIMALSSLGLALGFPYRLSCVLFTASFAWHFFVEATNYNNHYYLKFLLGFHFLLTDADVCLAWKPFGTPPKGVRPIPYFHHFMFRGLVIFLLFCGGVSKFNADWLSGHVMRAGKEGPEMGFLITELVVIFLTWGGFVFDLLAPIYLLVTRTRPVALAVFVMFNLVNSLVFVIGIFPFMMLGALPFICETGTLRSVIREWATSALHAADRRRDSSGVKGWAWRLVKAVASRVLFHIPSYRDAVSQLHDHYAWSSEPGVRLRPPKPEPARGYSGVRRAVLLLVLVLYGAAHIAMPLRHYYYHWGTGQSTNWTERGRKFGWHMMSRHKTCQGGLQVWHPITKQFTHITIGPTYEDYDGPIRLHHHQMKKILHVPSYIRQYAKFVRKVYEISVTAFGPPEQRELIETTELPSKIKDPSKVIRVHAKFECSLNGSPHQPFISPEVDVSREPPTLEWEEERFVLPQTKFGTEGYPDLGREWLP